jgi:hypothetical protein
MKAKLVVTLAAFVSAVAAAVVVVIVAFAGENGSPPPRPAFDHVSNAGTPVPALAPQDADALTRGGAQAQLSRLGQRGSKAFFAAPAAGRDGLCYGVGSASNGHLTALLCPSPDSTAPTFPARSAPILSFSPVEMDPRTSTVRFLGLAGLAADGVDRVGVIDKNGVLHAAKVVGNIYYADLPSAVSAAAIIALDSNGNEVFRKTFA